MLKLPEGKAVFQQGVIDLFQDVIRYNLLNTVLSDPGLAIGSSSKAKVKIVNTTTFKINGQFKSKTTAEIAFTATTHDIIHNATTAQERIYLYTIDTDGTVTVTAGEQANSGSGQLPEIPEGNVAVLGWVKLVIAAGSTDFDATTDDLDEAHITDTYFSGSVVPSFEAEQ